MTYQHCRIFLILGYRILRNQVMYNLLINTSTACVLFNKLNFDW